MGRVRKIICEKNENFPVRIMHLGKSYDLSVKDDRYCVKEFEIVINNDDFIENIYILNAYHPNAEHEGDNLIIEKVPPKRSKFCLPLHFDPARLCLEQEYRENVQKKLSGESGVKETLLTIDHILHFLIRVWYFDNPHHYPPEDLYITNPKI